MGKGPSQRKRPYREYVCSNRDSALIGLAGYGRKKFFNK
jgi:hypothetical protein